MADDKEAPLTKRLVCVKADALTLFPCVPKSGKIHKTSTHPDRVAIEVEQKQDPVRTSGDAAIAAAPAGGAAVAPKTSAAVAPTTTAAVAAKRTAAVATKTTYYIHPEYKQPEDVTDASTEQDAPEKRVWNWSGDESLYPFWAVERKSADMLRTKNREQEPEQKTLEINV